MGKISRILRVFTFVFGLFFVGNALAAGYTCTKTYTQCNTDYYLTASGANNSCEKCPTGTSNDNPTCVGSSCCVSDNITVTCSAGEYIAQGATTCSTNPARATGGKFAPGGTYTIPASGATADTGLSSCPGSYVANDRAASSNADCYLTTEPGKYVGTENSSTQSNCTAHYFCPGGVRVYYGSTGGRTSCRQETGSWSSSAAGSDEVEDCYRSVASGGYLNDNGTYLGCPANDYCPGATLYYPNTGGNVDCPSGYPYSDGGTTATSEAQCYTDCSVTCSGNDTEACPDNATCTYDTTATTAGRKYSGGTCDATAGLCPVKSFTCKTGYEKSTDGTSCVPKTVHCDPGQYLPAGFSTLCLSCSANSWCPGGDYTYSATEDKGINSCPDDYPYSSSMSDAITDCYANATHTASCSTLYLPSGCSAATCSCTYKDYYDTEESSSPCTASTVVSADSAKANYYVNGKTCPACSDASSTYIYSDGGNIASGRCYTYSTKTGTCASAYIPSGCSSAQCECEYKNYASGTDGTCTLSNVTSVTAKANYYANSSSLTCPACSTVSFSDSGSQSCSITNGSGTQTYSRTCYRSTSSAGATSSSQCSGSQNCGTKTLGTCYVSSCDNGYSENTAGTACNGNNIAISYDEAGGSTVSDSSCKYGGSFILPSAPSRTGYTFGGWLLPNGTTKGSLGSVSCTYDNLQTYSGTATITATWSVKSYSCNAGYYLPAGATSCSTCKAGYYCEGGTYDYNASSDQGLTGVCAANTYSTGGAKTSSCTACTSGYATSGTSYSSHDQKSDCSRTITLNKNGGSGTIQGKTGTANASIVCYEGSACNFGSASSLVPTSGGYKMSGGWGTSSSCTSTTTSFTTPTSSTYYACKDTCSYTNSTSATPSSNVCAGTCNTGYSTSGGTNTGTSASCSGTTCSCSAKSYSCNAGYYLPAGATSCSKCECGYACSGGTYSYNASTTQGRSQCLAGTYSSAGASSCTPASKGYYAAGLGACSQSQVEENCYADTTGSTSSCPNRCPDDFPYSNAGATSEGYCYANCTTSDVTGASSVSGIKYSDGVGDTCKATSCSANRYLSSGACPTCSSQSASYPSSSGGANGGGYCYKSCASKTGYSLTGGVDYYSATDTCSYEACDYTIKYNANGGSGTMADTSATYDTSVTLRTNTFTRTGYTFAGWATTSSGAVAHTDGKSVINLTSTCDGTVTLYAKWTVNSYSCSAGYYLPAGATSCSQCGCGYACSGGTYSYNASTTQGRSQCQAGTYSSAGASSCTSASKGYYVSSAGACSQSKVNANCYADTTGSTSSCPNSCPANSSSAAGSDALSDCSCNAGYGGNAGTSGGTCTACACGTYKSGSGNTACTTTTAGYYATGTGNTGQTKTDAGYYAAAGACSQTKITAGCYGPAGSSTSCPNSCPANSSSAAGSDALSDCSCNAGYGGNAGTSGGTCTACACGTYKSGSGNTACTTTTAGYYATGTGNTGQTKTDAGYYAAAGACSQTAISDGCYGSAGATNACPNSCDDLTAPAVTGGTFSSETPRSASTQCRYVAPAKTDTECSSITANTVSYTSSGWGTNFYTALAKAGSYVTATGNTSAPACATCEAGKYQGSNGSSKTSCDTCANWTFSGAGASSCTACPAVPDAVGGVAWTKASGTGWTTYSSCVVSQTPVNCASGSVKRTATSATAWGSTTLVTQLKSNAGYYASSTATSCTVCPVGSFCPASATSATACALGSYTGSTGQSACTACTNGTTTSGTGKTSCDATCANNNSYDNAWATASWSNNSVANLCKISNCKAGSSYSSATGTNYAGSCTQCSAGTYVSSSAHTTTSCSALTDACYGSAGATSACPNSCDDLTAPAVTGGTFSSETPRSASTQCRYVAPAKTDTECSSITANTVSYTSSGWGTNFYTALAKAGSYVTATGNTSAPACATCEAGKYQGSNGSSKTSCDTCANWTFSGAGASSCTACPALTSGWAKVDSTGTGWTTYTSCKQKQTPANCSAGVIQQTAASATTWGGSSVTTALKASQNYYVNNTACSACSGLGGGLYKNSASGNTGGASACYATTTDGKYISATSNAALQTCPKGDYCPATTLYWSNTGGNKDCPSGYTDGGTGYSKQSQCLMSVAGGKYVAKANESAASGTCAAGYYKPEHTVTYGGTSECIACSGATYAANTGQASCTVCPTATNNASKATGYLYWNTGGTADHTTVSGCYVTYENEDLDDGSMSLYYCYADTDAETSGEYGVDGTSKGCWVYWDKLKCDGGYYNKNYSTSSNYDFTNKTISALKTNACISVGTGYWSANDALTRTQCTAPLTTIGYGTGANEADDCGRKLHAGSNVVYLRSEQRSTPSLRVKVGDETFFGALSESLSGALKVNKDGKEYSVVNDWQ